MGRLDGGVYTYYLTKALYGEADEKPLGNEDGYVSFSEATAFVTYAMRDWSLDNPNMRQIPWESTSKTGEFFITKTGKAVPSIPSELRDVEYRDMLDLSGGSYTQKSVDWDGNVTNSFRHSISDLWLSPYEVTYELWYEVYQWAIDNGYKFANEGREGHDGKDGAKPTSSKHEPVTVVNWRDSIVWCNAYSELMGYDPVYYDDRGNLLNDSRYSNGDVCDNAEPDWSANGYRLPTEGEWQYFASEGGDLPPNYASGASDDYKNSSATGRVAWYDDNSGDRTHAVGTKDANALGLHDMSGNVWEWCWDWKDDYPTSAREDYTGPADGSGRVFRGGSWNYYAECLRVGFRNYYFSPDREYGSIGFRVARRP